MTRWLALALVVAGCAVQHDSPSTESGTITGNIGDARNRARIHTDLAAAYYERGTMGVALEELRTATAADDSYAPAYGLFGLVYTELREKSLAEGSFERALRLARVFQLGADALTHTAP